MTPASLVVDPTDEDLCSRFLNKVQVGSTATACWMWLAGRDRYGYGKFHIAGRHRKAHRVAYELFCGPIPATHQIDHVCRNRACVNPDHLEPVTNRENTQRGWNARGRAGLRLGGTCKRGHPFDEANTLLSVNRRSCRACHRERQAVKATAA